MTCHDGPRSSVGSVLHRIVQEQPGIHFRGLERAACLSSAGQLRHHLDHLKRRGAIVEVHDGGYHRFFAAGSHDRHLRPMLARFARPIPRKVAKLLLMREMQRTELRRAIGCADSTLGYYLTRMERQGDIVRRQMGGTGRFALADAEVVRAIFAVQPDGPGGVRRPVTHDPMTPGLPTALARGAAGTAG